MSGTLQPLSTYAKVLEGAELVKREKVDFILAVGGGSVMDCVKCIAAAAKAPKDLWEMEIDDHVLAQEGVPYGAIVTLSGTGSEMDNGAGITNEEKKIKFIVSKNNLKLFLKFILSPLGKAKKFSLS